MCHQHACTARRLWHDDRGSTSPEAMILVTVITVLGAIVGLVTLRDHIVQQFGDAAVALGSLDQTYSYYYARDSNGDGDFEDAGEFEFQGQYIDDSPTHVDTTGVAPAGLTFSNGSTSEGSL